ncbi:hypothetical protein P7F88_05305 [Vibrio hannami]|uniref:hypothetical protein n=1 Tax=Vibrio hannami TaxID=2717094 RepID=UPI00240EFA6B|nr:hypothetical protein [Vibrio hannami]MDG3085550.1 hypothetical protein [Vibrio hannami]
MKCTQHRRYEGNSRPTKWLERFYNINWKAKFKDNQSYDGMVHQELRVIRICEQHKLTELEANIF